MRGLKLTAEYFQKCRLARAVCADYTVAVAGRKFEIDALEQGLGAEIAFAVFAWKKWNIGTTILSGALAGVGCWAYYWATNPGWNGLRVTWYLVGSIISGVVIAGVVVWYLSRALAVTGALERFESGRSKARV